MDPLTWALVLAALWLIRIVAEELLALIMRRPSPSLARKALRAQIAEERGVTTVGQALADRLANRIANPPERTRLVALRGLLDELCADSLMQVRVMHRDRLQRWEDRRVERARTPRQAGWKVRTGPDPDVSPTPPTDDVQDLHPCVCACGCDGYVDDPDGMCQSCGTAAATPAPKPPEPPDPRDEPDPVTAPIPVVDAETPAPPSERNADPMATHTINADVRDPRTSLGYATSCRGFNMAIAREFDLAAARLRQLGLGAGFVQAVNVLDDSARAYSDANAEAVREYADHVLVQQDVHYDEDVRDTVRGTYLDMKGSDYVAPPAGQTTLTQRISAADIDSAPAAVRYFDAVAKAYEGMRVGVDQVKGAHIQQRITGRPLAFCDKQLQLATVLATKSAQAADRARRHVQRAQDTVGRNPALPRTQQGRYLDPAKR